MHEEGKREQVITNFYELMRDKPLLEVVYDRCGVHMQLPTTGSRVYCSGIVFNLHAWETGRPAKKHTLRSLVESAIFF